MESKIKGDLCSTTLNVNCNFNQFIYSKKASLIKYVYLLILTRFFTQTKIRSRIQEGLFLYIHSC